MKDSELLGMFDFVISFGFIDCSNSFYKTFNKIVKYLKPDGKIIFDLRLTNKKDLLDINESFQYLDYTGEKTGEKIPYNVLNIKNFTEYLSNNFQIIIVIQLVMILRHLKMQCLNMKRFVFLHGYSNQMVRVKKKCICL